MAYKFEIHKDKTGQFRVRFKYSGEVIFSTEAYTTKASAQKAIKSIKEKGATAPIDDLTVAAPAKAPSRAPAKSAAKKTPPKSASKNSTVASATAKPVAAAKAAAKAVGSAIKSAVKTTAK